MAAAHQSRWLVTTGRPDPDTAARLLASLPGWFGIESANAGYAEAARKLPTYLAWSAGTAADDTAGGTGTHPVGILLARRHFPASAEIHLMAVEPALHRQGAGRALVDALTADLWADGCSLLQVKTRGPSKPDGGYALTRKFYLRLGFIPLEESDDVWGPDNPCLTLVKPIGQPAAPTGSDGTAFARTTSE